MEEFRALLSASPGATGPTLCGSALARELVSRRVLAALGRSSTNGSGAPQPTARAFLNQRSGRALLNQRNDKARTHPIDVPALRVERWVKPYY
jgi:hypothetical protein